MLLAARSFAVSRVAVVARPSRFAREGAPSGLRQRARGESSNPKESQGASLSDTQQDPRQRRARAAKRRRSRASYCRPLSFVHYRNRAQPARRDWRRANARQRDTHNKLTDAPHRGRGQQDNLRRDQRRGVLHYVHTAPEFSR